MASDTTLLTAQSAVMDTQPVFVIDSIFEKKPITPEHLFAFKDTTKKMTIDLIQQQTFLPIQEFPFINKRGRETMIYWSKLRFHNQLAFAREFWLLVNTHKSFAFLIRPSGEVVKTQTGFMMRHKDKTIREIKERFANYIPIVLAPGEQATLYVKHEYIGDLPFALKDIDRIETPVNVRWENLRKATSENFYVGFFQAIMLLLFFYALFYAFYAKEAFAIYLALYCILYSIYFLYLDGYIYKYTGIRNTPIIFVLLFNNWINSIIIVECLFIQKYLNLKKILPTWNKAFNGIIVIDIFLIAFSILYYLWTKDFYFSIIIGSIFQLIWLLTRPFFIVKFWRLGDIRIRIFTFAWSVGCFFSFLTLASFVTPFLNGGLLLKLAIGSYLTIIMVGLSYHAAKTQLDKLFFEKENIQQELKIEQQKIKQLEIEQNKELLEVETQRLKALDELKSTFFASVSHELRTPLTLMLAPIESTLRENKLSERAHTNLLLAKRSGQRLHKMINEILDLTKLEAGKLTIQRKPTFWYPFLKTIHASFESLVDQKDLLLLFDFQGNKNLQVLLDQRKVEVILLNLLSNAFKFTPKKGTIKIVAKEEKEHLEIKVTDTGRGIPAIDIPQIFNRFYQVKSDAVEGGTGIGLALSKEFIELLGGSIEVSSQLHKGTIFTIRIPKLEIVSKMTNQALPTTQTTLLADKKIDYLALSNQPAVNQQITTTILLVEDNRDLSLFMKSILINHYNVITAENGKTAWELLTNPKLITHNSQLITQKPALIISDIMMPEMDGYQLLNKLKNDDRLRATPVIMLTALAELKDKLKALRIGVDDYMTKPFEEEELIARIDNLLRNSLIRQTFYQQEIALLDANDTAISESAKEVTITYSQEDTEWLKNMEMQTKTQIPQFEFNVERLANLLLMSRRKLERKLKSLTGLTPAQYIQEIRYNEARYLLETQSIKSVKMLIAQIGVKDATNFRRNFKKRFGRSPSSYFV